MLKQGRIARRAVLGREDGIAMLTVLMLTIILTVIGVAAITTTSLDIKMAGGERLRESTLNAAEACMVGAAANQDQMRRQLAPDQDVVDVRVGLALHADVAIDWLIAGMLDAVQFHRLAGVQIFCIFRLNPQLHLDAIFRRDFHERRAGGIRGLCAAGWCSDHLPD